MYPYSKAIADELRMVRLVHRLSLRALDEHCAALRPGTKRTWATWATWDHGDQYILESTNEALNRVVDSAVGCAYINVRTRLTVKDMRAHRAELLRRMEEHFGFKAADLPGWHAVQDVTRDANATKHRAGLHFGDAGDGGVALAGAVALFRPDVTRRVYHVGRWVRALGRTLDLP
ncbi:MAG TPA: hypothetical protein VGD56_22475 [Gemmatirosa sp.]